MSQTSPEPIPEVGAPAPLFSTRNQFGQPISLTESRGAPTVLIFYPYAFSSICTGELRGVRDHRQRLSDLGVRVLAISCDPMFALRAYAEAEELPFDLLTDHWPHGSIARAYGIFDDQRGCALRGTFLLDADGVVRWRVVNGIGQARDLDELLNALTGAEFCDVPVSPDKPQRSVR
ncbi:MAG: peroxiredoxin [Microlunatus sp.]